MRRRRRYRDGTGVIDGLIEGPVAPLEDARQGLRRWVDSARAEGLEFSLSFDGPRFSLLPGSNPLRLSEGDGLQERTRRAIERLLDLFPAELRGKIFSTVRSIEYRGNTQRQSLYLVTARGILVQDREVPYEEEEHVGPRQRKALPFLVAGTAVALAVVMSAFVVDYPRLWRQLWVRYTGADPKRIEVDAVSVSRYVVVKRLGTDKTSGDLVIEISRGAGFPTDLATYMVEENLVLQGGEIGDLLALHRVLLDGALRVQYLDRRRNMVAQRNLDVRELLHRERVRVLLPIKAYPETTRLRFTY